METMRIVRLGVVIFLCKAFVCGFEEESSCTPGFESELMVFKVHRDDLHQGERLGRVIFNTCDGRPTLFQSTDKRFDVDTDGTVTLKRQVTLHEGHNVFSVHAWDSSGKKHTVSVRVELAHHHMDTIMNISSPQHFQMESLSDDLVLMFPKSSTGLKRAKRGWIIPPFSVLENSKGPFPMKLVRIRSGYASEYQMQYKITGEGVKDLDPMGIFTIDSSSGFLLVTRPIDRETKASYSLIAHATGVDGSTIAEIPVEIVVNVMDQNDNPPVFTQHPFNGEVPEAAKIGQEFMTITATDADDPRTYHADVRYSIVKQDPELPNPMLFRINSLTGVISVNSEGLDKEKWPKYTLTVVAADLEGKGFSTTGSAVITVTDSNDNATQTSPKITYKIGNDPAGWLSVTQDTVMIKVKGLMDRESPHVKDGKYTAIILSVDDGNPPATGTGTLVIQLEDLGIHSVCNDSSINPLPTSAVKK